VDDEPMITTAVRRILSPGHEVFAVHSAREALARIRAGERFDVILCDMMMPEMTGIDLHSELLQCARDQATRMIFLTGATLASGAGAFLDRTPNPSIEKPFDTVHLRAVVNDQIRGS